MFAFERSGVRSALFWNSDENEQRLITEGANARGQTRGGCQGTAGSRVCRRKAKPCGDWWDYRADVHVRPASIVCRIQRYHILGVEAFFFKFFQRLMKASNDINTSVQHAESYEFKLQLIYYKRNQLTLLCFVDLCMTLTFKGNSDSVIRGGRRIRNVDKKAKSWSMWGNMLLRS